MPASSAEPAVHARGVIIAAPATWWLTLVKLGSIEKLAGGEGGSAGGGSGGCEGEGGGGG